MKSNPVSPARGRSAFTPTVPAWVVGLAAAFSLMPLGAQSQDQGQYPPQQSQDPQDASADYGPQDQATAQGEAPALVGRVAFASGGVQFYSEADPQWRGAQLNQPVTSHNSLFTDANGRAEIRIGSAAVSLAENTQVDVSQLDDRIFDLRVVRGSISLRFAQIDADDVVRVETQGSRFEILKPGRFRVDAGDQGSALTVLAGQARALGANGSLQVDAGKSLRIATNGGQESFSFGPASANDFDRWTQARDQGYRDSQSARYVSRNMTGYEELDANGRWEQNSEYGPLWTPTTYVGADWAPYRNGHWEWVAPWGWTWIDDAPWGFAPFHYGRWLWLDGRWAWAPGAFDVSPVFAPALVGFYGGSDFSLAFSIRGGSRLGPAVGWYPLAPWERYTPRFTHDRRYLERVNNFRDFRGGRRPEFGDVNRIQGGTIVRREDFASRSPGSRFAARTIDPALIRRQPLTSGPGVQPARLPASSAQRFAPNGPKVRAPDSPAQFSPRFDRREGRPGDIPTGVSRPSFSRPEVGRADLAQPEALRSDLPRPEVARPAGAQPGVPGRERWQQRRSELDQGAQQQPARSRLQPSAAPQPVPARQPDMIRPEIQRVPQAVQQIPAPAVGEQQRVYRGREVAPAAVAPAVPPAAAIAQPQVTAPAREEPSRFRRGPAQDESPGDSEPRGGGGGGRFRH